MYENCEHEHEFQPNGTIGAERIGWPNGKTHVIYEIVCLECGESRTEIGEEIES